MLELRASKADVLRQGMSKSKSNNESYAVDLETGIDALLEEIETASAELKQSLNPDEPDPTALLSDDPEAIAQAQAEIESEANAPEAEPETEPEAEAAEAEPDVAEPAEAQAAEAEDTEAGDDEPEAAAESQEDEPVASVDADLASQVAALLNNETEEPEASASDDATASEPAAEPAAESVAETAPEPLSEQAEQPTEESVEEAAEESPEPEEAPEPVTAAEVAEESEAIEEELAAIDADLATTAEDLEESIEDDEFDAMLDGAFEDAHGDKVSVASDQLEDAIKQLDEADRASGESLSTPVSLDGASAEPADLPANEAGLEQAEAPAAASPVSSEENVGAEALKGDQPAASASQPAGAAVVTKSRRIDFAELGGRALGVLELASKPLLKQPPIVRDAAGWVAANTLFLGACVWIWHAWFQQPAANAGDVENVGLVESTTVQGADSETDLLDEISGN